MADMGGVVKNIILVIIGVVVVLAILEGLKQTALKSAYDAATDFVVNDSAGVEHSVSGSPLGGDTAATFYTLGQGIFLILGFVAVIMIAVKGFKG